MSSKRKHGNNGNGNEYGNNKYNPLPQRQKSRKIRNSNTPTMMNIGAKSDKEKLEAYQKQKAYEEALALEQSIKKLSMTNKKGGFRSNKKLKTKKQNNYSKAIKIIN